MTTFIYKSKQEVTPKSARIHMPITHVMTTPQRTRQIELNAPPEVIAQLLRAGWILVEDRTVKS